MRKQLFKVNNEYEHKFYRIYFWVKSAHIRSYSGPHFPAFGLNTERYSVFLRIHSECGKMRPRIVPNTDTFYAVFTKNILLQVCFF